MSIRNGSGWVVRLIAAGCLVNAVSAALAQSNTSWGWGVNSYGEIGDGTRTVRDTPVTTVSLRNVVSVAAAGGYGWGVVLYAAGHSLAVRSDGTAWGWGDNSYGDVGDGSTYVQHSPVQVVGLSNVIAVAAGSSTFLNNGAHGTGHSLALKSDGTVWSWGFNYYGQLGYGTQDSSVHPTPARVPGLDKVIAISAGEDDSLALKSDGTVWAWGLDDYGQLGDGNTNVSSSPVQVSGLTKVVGISAGFGHCLAVKSDGTVWAWGLNNYGQLGDGTTSVRTRPVQVGGLAGVTAVAAGGEDFNAIPLWAEGSAWPSSQTGRSGLGVSTTTASSAMGRQASARDRSRSRACPRSRPSAPEARTPWR
jgi:alpha-tubulin suppressor-like RCC1 family protein